MQQTDIGKMTLNDLVALVTQAGTQTDMPRTESACPSPTRKERLIPVPEWNQHHSWPPIGGLRWLIFNSRSNGFDRVVRRVGRRVLIDEAAFFQWVREGGAPASGLTQP